MKLKIYIKIILFVLLTISFSAESEEMIATNNNEVNIPSLDDKKIYFGHQSVGYNIISGLNEILAEREVNSVKIVDSLDFGSYKDDAFAHSRIGYNLDPVSKIIGFQNNIHALNEWKPDIALFKFCYVDFSDETDIQNIFEQYKKRMTFLKNKYPDIKFVHVTVPLTTTQTGFKAKIKKILNRPLAGESSNRVRNLYNKLIRETYAGNEPVFDLANIQSTLPDASRSSFILDGEEYYSLAEIYASDSGHLNKFGSRIVAEKFVKFLSGL